MPDGTFRPDGVLTRAQILQNGGHRHGEGIRRAAKQALYDLPTYAPPLGRRLRQYGGERRGRILRVIPTEVRPEDEITYAQAVRF